VAERRRDGARALWRNARLGIVTAVAAGFESVDADHLVARQSGGQSGHGVGLLERTVVMRQVGHETERIGGGLEEIGDDGNRLLLRRRPRWRERIGRPWWARIDRRLRQHVVGRADLLVRAALGDTDTALVGDVVPVGVGGALVEAMHALPQAQLRAIAGGRVRLMLRDGGSRYQQGDDEEGGNQRKGAEHAVRITEGGSDSPLLTKKRAANAARQAGEG